MLQMADDVWRWCEGRQSFGRTVTVKVKYGDFRRITRSCSRQTPVATHEGLRRSALELIRSVLPAEMGIRLVGVTVSNFAKAAAIAQLPEVELPIFEGVAK